MLKKSDKFKWTEEADKAVAQLKETLTKAPILASPKEEEPMLLYLTATNRVISAAIIVERRKDEQDIPDQHPIYLYLAMGSPARSAHPGPARKSWA